MHRRDSVTELLSLLLDSIAFDRVRLYVLNPVRKLAVLRYVIDRESVINIIDKEWEPLYEIPFNYKAFFKGELCETNNYKDIILKFNSVKSFAVDLESLSGTPDNIRRFHERKNIKTIALCRLCKTEKEFIGHIVVDKSFRENQEVTNEELNKFEHIVGYLSKSIINSLEKYERELQIRGYYALIDKLLKKIDAGYEIDTMLLDFVESILDACPAIDILQIKEIVKVPDKFRLSFVKVNRISDIDPQKREDIEHLQDKEYEFSDGHFVSEEVMLSMKSVFIRDMREREYYGLGNISLSKNDARVYIFERNMCEINIPLMFGNRIYGILDAHAKRPYSLNENTMLFLKDVAPWITLLLKTKEYRLRIDTNNIRRRINGYSEYLITSDDIMRNKRSELSRLYNIDELKMSLNIAMYQDMVYQHEIYSKKNMKNRFSKMMATSIFGISSISLLSFIFTGIVLINPIVSIFGLLSSSAIKIMTSISEKQNKVNIAHINKSIKEYVGL